MKIVCSVCKVCEECVIVCEGVCESNIIELQGFR